MIKTKKSSSTEEVNRRSGQEWTSEKGGRREEDLEGVSGGNPPSGALI